MEGDWVQFYDDSTNNPTSWVWYINGYWYSNLQSPTILFNYPGYYSVQLYSSNARGESNIIKTNYIHVKNTPPVANFSATPISGPAPLSVKFTDTSSGNGIYSWQWNFGDGSYSTYQSPLYIYNEPGVWDVSLTVENDGGSDTETKSSYITVTAPIPTPPSDTIRLYNGWNFVSTPKQLADGQNSVGYVFSGVDRSGHSILLYNAQTGMWSQMSSGSIMNPLDGIWVYSNSQSYVDITLNFASGISVPPTKAVYTGWNAIGFTGSNQASARDYLLSLDPNWISVIGYHDGSTPDVTIIRGSTDPLFTDSRPMYPTHGYWLSMTSSGTLQGML